MEAQMTAVPIFMMIFSVIGMIVISPLLAENFMHQRLSKQK